MPITLTRTVLVVLIPGGIALIAWIFLYLLKVDTDSADSFYRSYTVPINLCFFSAVVIFGTVFEGLNTHLEIYWDRSREAEYEIDENWYAYLACTPPTEPVGFKYMTRLVTTMYFELGMMWVSLSFGLGMAAIICTVKQGGFNAWALLSISIAFLAMAYFLWQARNSHRVLCKTRRELNRRIKC